MDPSRLQGKNSFVTGAARGMGAASAKSLVSKVADVCRSDLDQSEAQTVADRINDAGNGKAIAAEMDVTKREDNTAAEAATVDAFGWNNVDFFDADLNSMDLADIGFKKEEGQAYEDIVRDALQIKQVSYRKDITGCAVISLFPAEDLPIANRY